MKKIIPTIALLACTAANAEFFTGNQLLLWMQSAEQAERTAAMGYVAGVHDMGLGTNHCPPDAVSLGQVTDVVRKVLVEVPVIRDKSGDVIVNAVLKKAWPCAEQAPATPRARML